MTTLTPRQLFGLALVTLMWGLNWPIMKLVLTEMAPLHYRASTMGLGAIALGAWFALRGIRIWPRDTAEWRAIVVLGAPNILGWHSLSIIGVDLLPSGRAAILGFTMPVWTVLLAVLFYGERLSGRLVIAVAAVLGSIALLLRGELAQMTGQPAGVLWMQGAALSWALGTIWMRRARLTLPPQALVVWMLLLSTPVLGLLAGVLEPPQVWFFSLPVWICLLWSVFINYGAAQVIWFALARELPPTTSAMSTMAIPIVGVLSAPAIVGEWPNWQDLAAMAGVLVAIGAVLLRRP